MEQLLSTLRAAAEPTRLRLLVLLAEGELTVSELTQILGQSQPRVSRHLKLLCDAGLLDRFPEGAWVFYRVSNRGPGGDVAKSLLKLIPADAQTMCLDRERLNQIRQQRAIRAQTYFAANAQSWDQIRSLHADDHHVESALVDLFKSRQINRLVDMGTGTGRMLEVLSPHIQEGVGFDFSRDMLDVARTNLERKGLKNCMVRFGDGSQLPLSNGSVDAVTIHQVLHFAADPVALVTEAARVLAPGGLLAIVDFAPHNLESLRDEHAHRRLGFSHDEVEGWLRDAGLVPGPSISLTGDPLTVVLWQATRPTDLGAAQ